MEKEKNAPDVLVIHGPNLNMLGQREPELYGKTTLSMIDQDMEGLGNRLGLGVESFQSNHEGAIVDKIQSVTGSCHGIIINPAAYTHTSVAIRDVLLLLDVPIIEIHLSNIDKREPFRRTSMIADIVAGRIAGFGAHGYMLALEAMAKMILKR